LSILAQLKYLHLAYFSKPASRRRLVRAIKRGRICSILEIGIGDGTLGRQMIRTAGAILSDTSEVAYTGIDLFESRASDDPSISLKSVYRTLSATGAQIKLVPGNPFDALLRTANSLTGTDLLVIDDAVDQVALARAWFYVPRLLHADSYVFQQQPDAEGEGEYRLLTQLEIDHLAAAATSRRAA
jgi:hypothetical protein